MKINMINEAFLLKSYDRDRQVLIAEVKVCRALKKVGSFFVTL